MFYSISYFKEDKTFAYVDSRTFNTVNNALIRAVLHLQAHPSELRRANIIYQGAKTNKVVRSVALLVQEPKFQ